MSYNRAALAMALTASLLTTACVTDPNTGDRKVSRTALGAGIGALGGALVGGLIGGGDGRLVGAGIGGIAGAAIGYEKDKQIRELRASTAGTGVTVAPSDDGQSIMVTMPDGVTFDTGSYILKPQFRSTLGQVAQTLTSHPDSLIDVYGHTDATGTPANNKALSENRANTVADFLTTQGVNPARLRSRGFGETMPVASNATPEGRAKNRRVEIRIVPVTQEQVQAARQGG
jgi:outer membrane protein OmpA-like peptidoglycan-associated protein